MPGQAHQQLVEGHGLVRHAGRVHVETREHQQVIDDAGQPTDLLVHAHERLAVLLCRAGPCQRQSQIGLHHRQRCAELVGRVRGEPFLAREGLLEADDHVVKGGGHAAQLIVLVEGQTLAEVVCANLLRAARNLVDRPQRPSRQQPAAHG